MADISKRNRRQPSRLQKRAPASIQICPSEWNVAIPLLSPLIQSPTEGNPMAQIIQSNNNNNQSSVEKAAQVVVMKRWQHPAQPFCYESNSVVVAPRSWPFLSNTNR